MTSATLPRPGEYHHHKAALLAAASANTSEGYPRSYGAKAPETIVRDIIADRVILSRMGAQTLRAIIAKLAAHIRLTDPASRPQAVKEARRRARHD